MTEFAAALRTAIQGAHRALGAGDALNGERQAKAVSAIVKAERDIAGFLVEQHTAAWEDADEACRSELHRRLSRFVEAATSGAPDEVLAHIAATESAA